MCAICPVSVWGRPALGTDLLHFWTVSGYEHLKTIEALPTDKKDRPLQTVSISRCGELELQKRPAESADGQSQQLYPIAICGSV